MGGKCDTKRESDSKARQESRDTHGDTSLVERCNILSRCRGHGHPLSIEARWTMLTCDLEVSDVKPIGSRVGMSICSVVMVSLVATFAPTSPGLSALRLADARSGQAQSPKPWKMLFDGKDLSLWTQTGAAQWKVENGVIVGGQGEPGQRGSTLVSKDQYKDVELELDFMLAEQPSTPDGTCEKCTYNSGVYLRTGYQVNVGRREAGEFIGVVVHRVDPKAIRGNVLWLDKGDEKFPDLRKKGDWNHLQISFKGPRLQVSLNGTKICDVTDNPTDPAEAAWKDAGPIRIQWPPAGEAGGFAGFVKYRNIRIRELS